MRENLEQVGQQIWNYLPQLVGALLVLVVGWVIALAVAALVRGVFRRTSLDNRAAKLFLGEERAKKTYSERWAGTVVFYLVLALVFVAFFQALGLTLATEPLTRMLNRVLEYIPRLIGAFLLLVIAWLVANAMRLVVRKAVSAARLEQRLGEEAEAEGEAKAGAGLANSLGEIVYWLVFILFLPAVLGALALQGLLEPLRAMTERFLVYMPNIFAAAVIVVLGWFAARIIQKLATNLFVALGVDRLSEKAGLAHAIGGNKLSVALGMLVQVLILVPVAIAALEALAIEALTQPVSRMLDLIIGAAPAILGAGLVLLFAYVAGRLVGGVIANLLESVGFNSIPVRLGLAKEPPRALDRTLSDLAGLAVLVIVMFFATMEAARLLGFTAFADIVADLTVLIGQVLLGLVILAIGLWVANLVAEAVKSMDKPYAETLSLVARGAILVLVTAMALGQMGLANEIIALAFGLIVGSVAVAAAIAFGIGGRDIAKRKLEEWLK